MPEYVCPTCERHFHKWTVCKEHLEASGHAAGSERRALRKWADHADAQSTGIDHAGAQSTGGWSISREPALKKQRTPSSSDGATFWHQLLQMELAAQEAQVQHRLETWSNEALCQNGTRLQGMEAKLIGPKKSRSLSLRCAAGVRLPNHAFALGDVAIVSSNEPESVAVLAMGCVSSLSGSILQLALGGGTQPDPAFSTPGRMFRVDQGFKRTPFDRMQAALRSCDGHEPLCGGSKVWEAILPLVMRTAVAPRPMHVTPAAARSAEPRLWLPALASGLNASQQRALGATLELPISLIHGPPGTGKTTVLASAVHAALLQDIGAKVLLVAQTNDAVDNLVCAVLKSRCASQLATGELVRVGNAGDSVRPEMAQCSLDYLAKVHPRAPELAGLNEAMHAMYDPTEKSKAYVSAQRLLQKIEQDIIQNARIVATTLIKSGGAQLQAGASFSVVVLDEATQATLPASLIPLQLLDDNRPGSQRVVFAGDHKQLAPTVISVPAREGGYAVSIFEILIEQGGCPTLLLDTQYRMHTAISDFPRSYFYQGAVVDAPAPAASSPAATQLLRGVRWPVRGQPVALVRMDAWEKVGAGGSKTNPGEARAIVECVRRLRHSCPALFSGGGDDTVGVAVLTAYNGQKALIQALLRQAEQAQDVVVSTVDGFQGREAHVVLISMVRANTLQSVGFWADERRLNVVLTRARSALIVVGHPETLRDGLQQSLDPHQPRKALGLQAWMAWIERAGCCAGSVQELFPPPHLLEQEAREKAAKVKAAKTKAELAESGAKDARAQLEALVERRAARAAGGQVAAAAPAAPGILPLGTSKSPAALLEELDRKITERRGLLAKLNGEGSEVVKMRSELEKSLADLSSRRIKQLKQNEHAALVEAMIKDQMR